MSGVLRATGLHKRVQDGARQLHILAGVDLEVAGGEWLALVGPSGSGKSTLLHILGGLDRQYDGELMAAGVALHNLSDAQLAQLRSRTFGFVFQAYNLLGHLTALQNVCLPAYFSGAAANAARAEHLLGQVGLGDKSHRRPRALSGGERQRVAIARALYGEPKVLFCDEPTGNLDADTAQDVLACFAAIQKSGVALLMVTHDAKVAARAGRTLRLQAGVLA